MYNIGEHHHAPTLTPMFHNMETGCFVCLNLVCAALGNSRSAFHSVPATLGLFLITNAGGTSLDLSVADVGRRAEL